MASNFLAKLKTIPRFLMQNKKAAVLFLVFVLLISFTPLYSAHAYLPEKIGAGILQALADVVAFGLSFVFGIVQFFTGILPLTGAAFLNACVDMNFVVPLTPAHPQAAGTALMDAWQYTRGLANIILVIIFAWVAFATILRIKSYEIKTILPKLLIVGILINFIPVITGVIIDITNILTKYFAVKSKGAAQWLWKENPLYQTFSSWNSIKGTFTTSGAWTSRAAQGALGIVFNIISWGALLVYGLVFLARVAMIWLLVILAPLAWLGYLVPSGKRYWDMWWNQFILWSVVGIPMLFFLYLSGLILQKHMTACDINLDQMAGGGLSGFLENMTGQELTNLICNSRSFVVALIIMFVGLGISMTLMPKGAAGIVKQGKKATAWAQKKGLSMTREKMPKRIQDWAEKQASSKNVLNPKWGAGQTGAGGWMKRRMAGAVGLAASPINIARHKFGKAVGTMTSEAQRKAIAEAEKSVGSDATVAGIVERIRSAPDQATKIGLMNKLVKEGDLDDAMEAGLTEDEVKKARKMAKKYDMHKDIDSAMPQFAEDDMNEKLTAELAKPTAQQRYTDLEGAYKAELLGKMKPNRASQISDSVFEKDAAGKLKHQEIVDGMINKWSGSHMGNLLTVKGDIRSQMLEERIKELATAHGFIGPTAGMDYLKDKNKPLADWIEKSPGARGFFATI